MTALNRKLIRDVIHLRGQVAAKNDYAAAACQFLAVTQTSGAEDGLVTLARLRAGQMYDQAGRRDEAIVQYKIVLSRQNVFDSRDQAQRGLKQPSQNQ